MNKYLPLALGVFLASCGAEPEKKETTENTNAVEETERNNTTTDTTEFELDSTALYGFYVGDFIAHELNEDKDPSYSNLINLSIDSIVRSTVYGHSVVAGNWRPFKGSIDRREGISFYITAKEPGDDKYDGEFNFKLNRFEAEGTWKANDAKLAVTERKFTLKKEEFKYNPADSLDKTTTLLSDKFYSVNFEGEVATEASAAYNASMVELKKEDIENMTATDLELMRNAIYARHGYSFKNRKMRYYFDKYIPWYIPVTTDVRKDLTALEKKNIELIKRYEEHAARYYDSYGR